MHYLALMASSTKDSHVYDIKKFDGSNFSIMERADTGHPGTEEAKRILLFLLLDKQLS